MLDLKTIHSVLGEFEERGIDRTVMFEAIESAMATAYKREYGKRGQVIRAMLDMDSGTVTFEQVKTIVDDTMVRFPTPEEEEAATETTGHSSTHSMPTTSTTRHQRASFLVSTLKSTSLSRMHVALNVTPSSAVNSYFLSSLKTTLAVSLLRLLSRSSFRRFARLKSFQFLMNSVTRKVKLSPVSYSAWSVELFSLI